MEARVNSAVVAVTYGLLFSQIARSAHDNNDDLVLDVNRGLLVLRKGCNSLSRHDCDFFFKKKKKRGMN
jgi:hypothetical protein